MDNMDQPPTIPSLRLGQKSLSSLPLPLSVRVRVCTSCVTMFWPPRITLLYGALLAAAFAGGASALTGVNTTEYINDMFDSSMSYLDQIYDPTAGYLWYTYYPLAAGKHETRSSVWYAAGLLRRNEGSDVDEAVKILTSVIGDQQKNASHQWYLIPLSILPLLLLKSSHAHTEPKYRFGDYTKYPEEPTVGTAWYPEKVCRRLLLFL